MANSRKCYVCEREFLDSDCRVEIVIHIRADSFWLKLKQMFVYDADEFVCMECLEKGIVFDKKLKSVV